jgi:signal transduction protein with GAF and PtsI domain
VLVERLRHLERPRPRDDALRPDARDVVAAVDRVVEVRVVVPRLAGRELLPRGARELEADAGREEDERRLEHLLEVAGASRTHAAIVWRCPFASGIPTVRRYSAACPMSVPLSVDESPIR